VLVLSVDLLLYGAMVVGTATAESVATRLLFAVGAGIMIALTAIAGHDAGHQSFSSSKLLNRICGTIAFLPALHPFSLWEHHHNRVHHRFTAQLGLDNAFPPMTVEEYLSASPFRQAKYRFIRSLAGQPFFYLIDVWLVDICMPWLKAEPKISSRNWVDIALVYAFLPAFLAVATWLALPLAGGSLGVAFLNAALFSFLIPFLLWNAFISFLSIVQHTSPDVRWIERTGVPSTAAQAMAGTVHVVLPDLLDRILHRIMQHQAHHIHVGIPLHNLVDAQAAVSTENNNRLVRVWTPAYHLELTRRCKLYDPRTKSWLTFEEARAPVPAMAKAA
jgi:omega-6 fatty acid desaturase (delta-12 desaturase)